MPHDRIRLLKIITNFHIGGTERQFANLVQGLDREHFEVHLACLRYAGELARELEPLGLPIREFSIQRLWNHTALRQGLRFVQYLRERRIQIVHSYTFYANVFAVPFARLAGVEAVIASVRDIGDVLTPLQRRVQKAVCRFADCVLANSEAVRETLLQQGYDPKAIVVIRNGISPAYVAACGNRNGLRRELGIPPDAPLVAVFSRLNGLKGVDHFLEAAASVAPRFPEACFLIVGDGAIRPALEARARQLGLNGRAVFTGFRTDVPRLLGEVSVSVVPSLSEGLSNSLLESVAAGVPVVATRVGGNAEVVEHGVTGLIVPPAAPAAMAGALVRLLEDAALARRLSEAGRKKVNDLFSIGRAVRETHELYLELLEPRRCR
jgi:glycosyltransferase involved in cell wall biosynthesis